MIYRMLISLAATMTASVLMCIAQWDACRDKAVEWLGEQLAAGNLSKGDQDEQHELARLMSQQELAALGPLADIVPFVYSLTSRSIRIRVAQRALRAAHLDPTNERAAYIVACSVTALYEDDSSNNVGLSGCNRGIVEAQRYLDRFPKVSPSNRLDIISVVCDLGVHASQKIYSGNDKEESILLQPLVESYPYAKAAAYRYAEAFDLTNNDRRYATPNSYRFFSQILYQYLIRCIPEDKLDEEYEFWRKFYAEKVDPIVRKKNLQDLVNTRPLPWSLIDVLFMARKKEVEGVKKAFTQLAQEFPASEKRIWGGDQFRPERVPLLLRAAGADDWKTWQPNLTAQEAIKIDIDEMTSFLSGLAGSSSSPWELDKALTLPAQKVKINPAANEPRLPEGWALDRIERVFMAGDDAWFVVASISRGTPQSKFTLFKSPIDKSAKETFRLELAEVS